jgi:ABC-type Mn2+/Zn2+ transport system ATPase subunit
MSSDRAMLATTEQADPMIKLLSCKLANFKSYNAEAEIVLSPRITYILGPNNSGKTTLLEAIHSPHVHEPHRSPTTITRVGGVPRSQHSQMRVSLSITGDELREFLLRQPRELAVRGSREQVRSSALLDSILTMANVRVDVVANQYGTYTAWTSWYPHEAPGKKQLEAARFRSDPISGTFEYADAQNLPPGHGLDLGMILHTEWKTNVFRFRAERSRAMSGVVQPGLELAADADNLVAVLDNLQGRHNTFRKYLDYVRRVLPEIRGLGVVPTGQNRTGIRVWFFDGEREDFAMPIERAGSGVPNVLAQLYTITMSSTPRLILIDEPSAFLHPGATRELVRVIREFPQHQYIISSHQPIALDELDDVGMVLLKRDADGATTAQSVNPQRSDDQQAVLAAVGASLSDVFSADRVLWVEGMTETKVFRAVAGRVGLPRGAAILPIVNTGDLEGAEATRAIEIYRRLTESGALLPPAIAIVLDDEGRTPQAKAELRRRLAGTTVEFLPVRMVENVFLDADIVHTFLAREAEEWGPPTIDFSSDSVTAFWDQMLKPARYKVEFQRPSDVERWTRTVHGAQVLEDTVSHFTDNRFAYDKVKHGPRLARIAEERRSEVLAPVANLLASLLAANVPRDQG